ncbi:unnamed protein product, partial [Soboliphyme baturini]|uniref:Conserved oligomeric Golgi complex subunit 3 n=1 Tax=Soboliphyme baturini TaxID=241478 RepID=A0A183IGJ0_9BILA
VHKYCSYGSFSRINLSDYEFVSCDRCRLDRNQFFSLLTFSDFLEKLCRIFYNAVRPVVIHVQHLETLSELCIMFKVEMIEERCVVDGDGSPRAYPGLCAVLFELLGDVTERLIYRTEQFSEKHIAGYNPALAHRCMNICTASTLMIKCGHLGKISAADLHGLWYPTVQRTVMCLAKLYRCLEVPLFVHQCFKEYWNRCSGLDALNSHLFVIKHLLILREQTASFRADTFQESHEANYWNCRGLALPLFSVSDSHEGIPTLVKIFAPMSIGNSVFSYPVMLLSLTLK